MKRRERHLRRAGGLVATTLLVSAVGMATNVRPSSAEDVLGVVRVDAPAGTPSSYCQANGGQQLLDVTSQGVHTKLYVLASASTSSPEVAVCYLLEAPDGTGEGGKVSITPAAPGVGVTGVGVPTVGLPSTDNASGQCSTTTPNSVPGTHPISEGSILGVPFMVDAYSGPTGAWACIEVLNTVTTRVVVPTTPPVTGTPGVTFDPAYVVTISRDAA